MSILTKKIHKRKYQAQISKKEKRGLLPLFFSRAFDLVVLDEINVALNLKLISKKAIISLIKKVPENMNLILTGRGALPEVIKLAHLVTEFREEKHPFALGIKAKKGVEY